MTPARSLFGDPFVAARLCPAANRVLRERHYLGPTMRGEVWFDDDGVLVLSSPSARHIPTGWLELSRWCLTGGPNAGSRQWRKVVDALRIWRPHVTTVVSYSDPSVGHTGALYRACNWLWAPTWHRLCPPPTGNGAWSDGGKRESVKDRWVYPLREDAGREAVLAVEASYERRFPGASYREPRVKRGHYVLSTGGGNFKRWGRAMEGEK